jgi:hypothetical protein
VTSATATAAAKEFLGCPSTRSDPPFFAVEWDPVKHLTRFTQDPAETARPGGRELPE